MSTDQHTDHTPDDRRTVLLPLQGSKTTGAIARADTRLFHRPKHEGALRAACGSFRADGQAVARADATALNYRPCQRPACFGAPPVTDHDDGGEPA